MAHNAVLPTIWASSLLGSLLLLPEGAISAVSRASPLPLGLAVEALNPSEHAAVLAKAAMTLRWLLTFSGVKY